MDIPTTFTLYVNDVKGDLHKLTLKNVDRAIFMKAFDINNRPADYASDLWDTWIEPALKPGARHN
jgi:hypothetical protein